MITDLNRCPSTTAGEGAAGQEHLRMIVADFQTVAERTSGMEFYFVAHRQLAPVDSNGIRRSRKSTTFQRHRSAVASNIKHHFASTGLTGAVVPDGERNIVQDRKIYFIWVVHNTTAYFFAVQIQNEAAVFYLYLFRYFHILQQCNDCTAVFRFERIVQITYIGSGTALFDLRNSRNLDIHRPIRVRHVVIPYEFCNQGDRAAVRFHIPLFQYIGGVDCHGVAAVRICPHRIGHLIITHKHCHLTCSRCGINSPQTSRRFYRSRPGCGGRGLDGDGIIGGEVAAFCAVFTGFHNAFPCKLCAGLRYGKCPADFLIAFRECNCIRSCIFYNCRFDVTRPPLRICGKLHPANRSVLFQYNLVCIVLPCVNQPFRNRNRILIYIDQEFSVPCQSACSGQRILFMNTHRTVVFQCNAIGNRQSSALWNRKRIVCRYGQIRCKGMTAVNLISCSRIGFEKFINNSLHRAAAIYGNRFLGAKQELTAVCNL